MKDPVLSLLETELSAARVALAAIESQVAARRAFVGRNGSTPRAAEAPRAAPGKHSRKPLHGRTQAKMLGLLKAGKSLRVTAEESGVSENTVTRYKKRFKEQGKLK